MIEKGLLDTTFSLKGHGSWELELNMSWTHSSSLSLTQLALTLIINHVQRCYVGSGGSLDPNMSGWANCWVLLRFLMGRVLCSVRLGNS
jgi:hypothetical protein